MWGGHSCAPCIWRPKRIETALSCPRSEARRFRKPLSTTAQPATRPHLIRALGRRDLVLLFVVDKVIGLRVSPDQEAAGLDLSQHGEEGYDLNS